MPMTRLSLAFVVFAPLASPALGNLEVDATDDMSLLQLQRVVLDSKESPKQHYWPRARGKIHHYSQSDYPPVPLSNNNLAFRWDEPSYNSIIWGALIDGDKNIYVTSLRGTTKLSPDGAVLWKTKMTSEMPTLVGDTLVGMRADDCMAYALSLATGEVLWQKQVWPTNGAHGDFVEVHNGVAVVGVGRMGPVYPGGQPSERVAGLDLETRDVLWNYKLDCGIWNVMALFPDEDTTIVNDMCGGLYRLGLRNGTLLWKSLGPLDSFTDGGAILGPDGDVYACSNPSQSIGQVGQKGVLHRHRLSDGMRLWEVELPYPCVNIPGVTKDGGSVIVAPGALAIEAATKKVNLVSGFVQKLKFYLDQERLVKTNQQRTFYGLPNLEAAVMSFNTTTGKLIWRFDVPPYGGLAFAGDEKRAYLGKVPGISPEHCWPAHWSAPTIDVEGTVHIGRSTGTLYAIRPDGRSASTLYTGDGTLMAGAAFAPGMMVWTTCSSVYVFKSPSD